MSDTANTGQNGEQGVEPGAENIETETPTVESLSKALETLTAESRKWEGRAKENFEARKELDALKVSKMTDTEKAEAAFSEVEKRATDAEDRASKAEAELARYKVAVEFELDKEDTEALAAVSDEATLRALAERLAGRSNSGPKPNPSQGRSTATAPTTAAQAFADSLEGLF